MNFKEYQELAPRTNADLGSLGANLAHMVLGMMSEVNELEEAVIIEDSVNILEEISDMQWYFANYCTLRGISVDLIVSSIGEIREGIKNSISINDLYTELSILSNTVKRLFAYGKEIPAQQELDTLTNIQTILLTLCKTNRVDVFKGLENNINKLKIRYPEKFDSEKAINRDLEAERKELEK